jgi:hypothetical protein
MPAICGEGAAWCFDVLNLRSRVMLIASLGTPVFWSPKTILPVLARERIHDEKSTSARRLALLSWQSKFPVREGSKSTPHHAFEVPHGLVSGRSSVACGDAASFWPST